MSHVNNFRQRQQQLMQEIAALLTKTAESNNHNALLLNQEMQHRLEEMRVRIIELLKLVRARYAHNEEILIHRQQPRSHSATADKTGNVGKSGAVLRGGTFRFKGNLYFRDVDGRSCPNNEDYEKRSSTEMFPTDFDMRSKHVWTVLDKKNVVMGIKQQLLDHASYQTKSKGLRTRRMLRGIDLHTQTLASMLAGADSSFSIDWHQISSLDVEYRHSAYSCKAMWLVYLHPQLKRDNWTSEEDEILVAAARAHNMQNWPEIAAAVHQRSDYQCFVRLYTALRYQLVDPTNKFKWTWKDNDRLRRIVLHNTVNGVTNWSQVVEHFPGRSRSTLIGRYMYVLHPSISHEPFTTEEDITLFAAVEEYNGKFNCIPRTMFPNRSLAQLRTRYHNVLAQRNKTNSWSVEDDTKLMAFVTLHGTSQWVSCADHLGNHTRTSCRTRFLVIKRFMEKHPDATVTDIPRRKHIKKPQVTTENWTEHLKRLQKDANTLLNVSSRSKPTPKRCIEEPTIEKKPTKRMRFLSVENLEVYDYFKYAYNLNLKLPSPPVHLPTQDRNILMISQALRFRPPTNNPVELIHSVCLPKRLSSCYNTMLCQLTSWNDSESTYLLPPNWSTLMGFRAICILAVDSRKDPETVSPVQICDAHMTELFRQRLRTLFYKTILLTRMGTDLFKHLPKTMMKLPRPPINYSLPKEEPTDSQQQQEPTDSQQQQEPTDSQQQQEQPVIVSHRGLSLQDVARRQLEELDGMTKKKRKVISEPDDCKVESKVKQELPTEMEDKIEDFMKVASES